MPSILLKESWNGLTENGLPHASVLDFDNPSAWPHNDEPMWSEFSSLITIDRILAVIGIIATWLWSRYYYRRSEKKRAPTFILQSTERLSNEQLTQVQGLSILCNGSEVGKNGGISAAKIYFWNSGSLPILKEEVLQTYKITLTSKILEYSILKVSREIVGLQVSTDKDSLNSLELGFSVLEPGDGATIRLVFDGSAKQIEFTGACLDAPKPIVLPSDDIYSIPRSKHFGRILRLLTPFFPIIGCVLLIFIGDWLFYRYSLPAMVIDILKILGGLVVAILGMLLLVGLSIAFWYQTKRINSPYLPPDIKD